MIKRFEDIVAWKKSQELALEIYSIFKLSKDYGFKDQICRAVISISSNIAEGFDRSSDAYFSRFLYMALSSCSEVRSMTYLAKNLKYISSEQSELLISKTSEISKITRGLIKSLK